MLSELLHSNAATLGDHPALECGEDRLTYDTLLERTTELAGGLESLGVGRGDVVMLLLPNVPDFVVGFLAAATVGAAAVVCDPASGEYELQHVFSDCRPRAVITDQRGLGRCHAVASELGVVATLVAVDAAPSGAVPIKALTAGSRSPSPVDEAAHLPALFQYSSGSTGRSKRVGRTQAQCVAEARLVTETLRLTPDDRILCCVPLFHAYGFGDCMLAALGSGATLVVQPHVQPFAVRRSQTLELVESRRITVLPIVPYMADLLVGAPGAADLSSLRYCFTAGAALTQESATAFCDRFGVPARQLYGCTESPSIAANLDEDPSMTAASVGRAMHGVGIRIEPVEGESDLAEGVGEVVVTSPAAASGYWGDTRGDDSTFTGGSVRPGDLGRFDEDGRLFLVGRTKLFIEVHGHKVDPFEVEDVLSLHPAVREVVVVGVPDPAGSGEAVKAAIVASSPVGERELVHHCRERLAGFKVPRIVEFRDEIPRSPLGKILRKELV